MVMLVLLVTVFTQVVGYKRFQAQLPNSDRVPHPCGGANIWGGLGHFKPGGGGPRTQFGMDFKQSGMKWTRELCMRDSDGDGRTNGQELGDPDCLWRPGATKATIFNISHPGVCEPLDSPSCVTYNSRFGAELNCAGQKPFCPAISESSSSGATVTMFPLVMPLMPIPATVTNYRCMVFDLPSHGDFHLIATTPRINNTAIVHHILLFGCTFHGIKPEVLSAMKAKPYTCGMSPHHQCTQIIGTWTVGSQGDCMSPNSGFRIGNHGYKMAAMQVHWHNPEQLSGEVDNSGLNLYYTDQRRTYDAAMMMLGQEYIHIPAKSSNVVFESTCPSDCTTEMLQENIYITRAVNHMHYLGVSQQVTLYRNGQKLKDLTDDHHYSYDNPQFYYFDPPVEVRPGDEIRTVCTYNNTHSYTVRYGAGTTDEMCYGFLTYYPKLSKDFTSVFCASWKSVQRCRRYLEKFDGKIDSCVWRQFLTADNPDTQKMYAKFISADRCGHYLLNQTCSASCTAEVARVSKHPCFQGDIGDYIKYKLGQSVESQLFLKILKTCRPVSAASRTGVFCDLVSVLTGLFLFLVAVV